MHTDLNIVEENRLKEKLADSREKLLSLVDDWHFFNTQKLSELNFEYEQLFGDLEYEINQKNLEVDKIQKHIDNFFRNRTKPKSSFNSFNNYKNKEDNDDNLRKLYRTIVKKLHPDTCDSNELNQKYWNKVQLAYQNKNDRHLEIIFDSITSDYNSLRRDQMRLEIKKLERYINDEKKNLSKLKLQEPFIYENKLKDRSWVNQRKQNLEEKLALAERRLKLKKEIYENLMRRKQNSFVN
jgi:exonuclease VII large subunit